MVSVLSEEIPSVAALQEDKWHGEDTIFWFSVMQRIRSAAIADAALCHKAARRKTHSAEGHGESGRFPVLPRKLMWVSCLHSLKKETLGIVYAEIISGG
jgi:hypothetical protein